MKNCLFIGIFLIFFAGLAGAEERHYINIGGNPVEKEMCKNHNLETYKITEDKYSVITDKDRNLVIGWLRSGEEIGKLSDGKEVVCRCGNQVKFLEIPKPELIPIPPPVILTKLCEAKFIGVETSTSPDKLVFVGSVNGADRVSFEYDTGASFTNPVATQGTSVPEQAIIDVESFSLAPGNNYYVRVKGVTTDGEICYSSPFGFKFMSRAVAQAQIQEDSWIGTGLHCAGTGMIPYGIYAKNPWIWGAGIAANIIGYLADRNISNRDIGAAIFCGVAGGFLGEGAYNKGGHIANKIKPGPHPEMPVIPIIEHPTIPSI